MMLTSEINMDLLKITMVLFLMFPFCSNATEFRLVLPTISNHIGSYDQYNNGTSIEGNITAGELLPGDNTSTSSTSIANTSIAQVKKDDINNENYGIGFEASHNGYLYTAAVLENSFNETSLYLGFSKESRLTTNLYYTYGLTVANGYSILNDSGYLVSPNISLRYKFIRISTTYPLAQLTCPTDGCADVVNLQFVMPF